MTRGTFQGLVLFVDERGVEVDASHPGAIELRSAGAGWRWMDQTGREWGTAGAPIDGERLPRWRVERRLRI